jgi:NADH dehydrogenase [ubiquinone] 1 alpha subcomplex assembly factor 7
VPSAADQIVAAVARDGPLRFDRYMQLALYGDHGFYTSGGTAGRRGDFITSPEVGPLFGTVLARYIEAERRRLGSPDDFTVVEVGAGPGALARSVLAAVPDLRYVAVELSDLQRNSHPSTVTSTDVVPSGPVVGVILANELLDNLPFRLLVFDGGWREAHVAVGGDRFVEVLLPLLDAPAWLPHRAPHGARLPWQQGAAAWVAAACAGVSAGSVLAFDYVTTRSADLAAEPWRAWLRTYQGHQRGQHYLVGPGTQDITAQVALDQLPPPSEVVDQATFLRRWGIDDLVDEGRRLWEAAAASPTVQALKMRSRVRESEALVAADGLGSFTALRWQIAAFDPAEIVVEPGER